MFDPQDHPRVFALPCGVDFGAELVNGLIQRSAGHPPEVLARAELYVNTLRLQRRVSALFDQGPPMLLPRMGLITTLIPSEEDGISAATPLAERLSLVSLVRQLITAQPDLAPQAALFDLADSVAALMAEMKEEGVGPEVLAALDVTDQSGHWQRTREFLNIVLTYKGETDTPADPRQAITALIAAWQANPPQHPIILAGSTGSRGPAHLLMQAVARLPQGAVILPGVDTEMPAHGWHALAEAELQQDHPQYRMLSLCQALDLDPQTLPLWTQTHAPSTARNALVSLALRPAPVTHAWLHEGPDLPDPGQATEALTLVEAPSQRDEALAIALRLRQAAEDGTQAALISPDRTLTRLVAAMLDQWDITPDDSAGIPLHLTPPGRFLRHVANLRETQITAEALLVLLKHPLCHSGPGRSSHLRLTRDLELQLRADGPPFPDAQCLHDFAAAMEAKPWGEWLVNALFAPGPDTAPVSDHLAHHIAISERLAAGQNTDQDPENRSGGLWDKFEGLAAERVIAKLTEAAPHGPDVTAQEYAVLIADILSREQQRNRDIGRANIRIWGTLEARVMDADLLILGGLNEGSWPEAPSPDPWLNRAMRKQAGLLLPERRTGLSAHDFQQAIGGQEVWLTRALRTGGAETVPSRWLNRLTNLLDGLEMGRPALEAMRDRGARWVQMGRQFEAVTPSAPAPRPSPRPPVTSRPRKLSVTQIKTLVRDPYALYARHVLGLIPLDPLAKTPDAATRGTILHRVLEEFIQGADLTPRALLQTSTAVLADEVPWPETRLLWQARVEGIAADFIEQETARQAQATPTAFEVYGRSILPHLDFTLTAKADRIDMDAAGALHLYDYKTGHVPTDKEQKSFDKQLLLMTAMAEAGAFAEIPASPVTDARFLGLGRSLSQVPAPLASVSAAQTWDEFEALITAMQEPGFGFSARRAMQRDGHGSPYDHLARYGEWDTTQPATPEDVT